MNSRVEEGRFGAIVPWYLSLSRRVGTTWSGVQSLRRDGQIWRKAYYETHDYSKIGVLSLSDILLFLTNVHG